MMNEQFVIEKFFIAVGDHSKFNIQHSKIKIHNS